MPEYMFTGIKSSVLAIYLGVFASTAAHAEVYEIGHDGNVVEITRSQWQPESLSRVSTPEIVIAGRSAPAVTIKQHLESAAERFGISSALVNAVAWQESRYNNNARSPVGAIGIMQLMPSTARGLRIVDPTDLGQNIAGGAAYLRSQLDRFGNNVPLALAAYNAGPGAVQRYGGIPPFRETQNYVRQIMSRLAMDALGTGPN